MPRSQKRRIDMSDVDPQIRTGGTTRHVDEGNYELKIVTSEIRDGKVAEYYNWTLQIVDGKFKGTNLYLRTSLSRKAMFQLRNLIHAAIGKNKAGSTFGFDPEILYGKNIGATVIDSEWTDGDGNQRISSQVNSVFPVGQLAEMEAEEEEEEIEEEQEGDVELEDTDIEEL